MSSTRRLMQTNRPLKRIYRLKRLLKIPEQLAKIAKKLGILHRRCLAEVVKDRYLLLDALHSALEIVIAVISDS